MKRRRSARFVEKRRRAEEAEDEQEAEEQMARGTIDIIMKERFEGGAAEEGLMDTDLVDSIRRRPDTGPPWYDDVSGEPFDDDDAVREAMKKEMESMTNFGVFREVPEKEAYENPDAIIVGGGVVGAAVGNAIGGKSESPTPDSLAQGFPDIRQAILALSDRRWILFEQSAMSGAAKAITAQWPLDVIDGLDMEKGKLTSKLTLRFVDGSFVQLEAVRAAKPDRLVEAAAG